MKILFLTSGRHVPSTRFRILPYLPHLRALGHQCTVLPSFPQKYDSFRCLGFRRSQSLKRAVRRWHLLRAKRARFDAIVLEREVFDDPTWEFERRFRQLAPAMLLDFDDAVFLRYPEKFRNVAGMVDHVLAGNRELADVALKYCDDVTILPTAIEPAEYPIADHRATERPVIGWIGTTSNVDYLRELAPVLSELNHTHDFVLRVVTGEQSAVDCLEFGDVDVEFRRWRARTAPREVSRFDVGIMPLPDTEWTRYKCGFKLLQYLAAGVPAVASPVGVNCEIIRAGETGFLPATADEWHNTLRRLLDDDDLRRTMGARGRESLADRYTVESNVPRLLEALENSVRRPSRRDAKGNLSR